jgi:hypothetical protein
LSRAKSYTFKINKLAFFWPAMIMAAWFCLVSAQALGEEIINSVRLLSAANNDQQAAEPITSGVYGPFPSYYHPALFFGDDVCWLDKEVIETFQVRCLPIKATAGVRLARSDESAIIQAQLGAVNGPAGKPMPEFILNFSLADMEQSFLAKDIAKRLLRAVSIFDDVCKLTYQVDGQPPATEEWRCSSFLYYGDRYVSGLKLSYEARVRPVALWPGSDKAEAGQRDWSDFFKSLDGHKQLKVKVILNEEPLVEAALDLTGHNKWPDRLLTLSYDDAPEQQPAIDDKKKAARIVGPFDHTVCEVNRYVAADGHENGKRLYKGMFLVNCDQRLISSIEAGLAKWLYELVDKNYDQEASANDASSENSDIDIYFKLQSFDMFSNISIRNIYGGNLAAFTSLRYPLFKMGPELFKSKLTRDTLNDEVSPELPCAVSYKIDGRLASNEYFKCNSSYDIFPIFPDGIGINIEVDYGLSVCYQAGDLVCQKDALNRAASFLKEIKEESQEIIMEIKFENGEIITAKLDLSSFKLESIGRLFKQLESLSK